MKPQRFLSREETQAWEPDRTFPERGRFRERLVGRLKEAGLWTDFQVAGRRWAMGCVAVEITQRCNLDCTLCYLSEHAEAVRDVPLGEIFRRIEAIRRHYGPFTDVQVTGGDPTLRKRGELVQIVRRIHDLGMRPSLFTNGIRATRELLTELTRNGLVDVAFHVDMTQERKGFGSEAELNRVRLEYIERARGLPLSIIFNTTVFADNFAEIPDIVAFFRAHADVVDMCSFQLQAETGRGVLRKRGEVITRDSVAAQISRGAGRRVNFGVPTVGHPECNQYAICLEAGGNLYNLFEESGFFAAVFARTAGMMLDRRNKWRALGALLRALLANPALWPGGLSWLARKSREMGSDVLRARGRVNKLSFFIHNFMDADQLDRERCRTCVFMVAGADGPISMCVFNARRDAEILRPLPQVTGNGLWYPLTEPVVAPSPVGNPPPLPIAAHRPPKWLRGRTRKMALENQKRVGL